MTRRASLLSATLLTAAALLFAAAPSQAASVRVPPQFFGINFQKIRDISVAQREKHLQSLSNLPIREMRVGFSWKAIEPVAPKGSTAPHDYRWEDMDAQIAALARYGFRAQANMTQTPVWNALDTREANRQCQDQASSRAPRDVEPYWDFAKAVAQRYGRGGAFWAQNPGLNPSLAIVRYEVWNEPNLKGGWCPYPEPERYARLFVGAALAIRSVDSAAEVMTGGVAQPKQANANYFTIWNFLRRAIVKDARVKTLASAAAVHIYPSTNPTTMLQKLAWFRDQLRQGKMPDTTPMLINELGWATRNGSVRISESTREAAYAAATQNFSRTNCNVSGILPQTWFSNEVGDNPEAWYGIAAPFTAEPYPSAIAYVTKVALMRGQLATEPPFATISACPGMPLPNQDGDAWVDQSDYYPLDPTRH